MKKNLQLLAFLAIALILGIIFSQRPDQAIGSVVRTGEYQATTTNSMTGDAILAARTMRLIQTGQSTLGSIVVSSTSPSTVAPVRVWNATSTTDIASTSVVLMPTASANGTYTYDISLTRGLIIELPGGYNGAYTVTFR